MWLVASGTIKNSSDTFEKRRSKFPNKIFHLNNWSSASTNLNHQSYCKQLHHIDDIRLHIDDINSDTTQTEKIGRILTKKNHVTLQPTICSSHESENEYTDAPEIYLSMASSTSTPLMPCQHPPILHFFGFNCLGHQCLNPKLQNKC